MEYIKFIIVVIIDRVIWEEILEFCCGNGCFWYIEGRWVSGLMGG